MPSLLGSLIWLFNVSDALTIKLPSVKLLSLPFANSFAALIFEIGFFIISNKHRLALHLP